MSILSLFNDVVGVASHAVTATAAGLAPVLGGASAAAAIVACTMAVRLALVPLALAQVRAERARTALAPKVADLRRRHQGDAAALGRELTALYRAEGVSPLAGCLPALAQWPVFSILYRLSVAANVGGHPNGLLAAHLLGVRLGARYPATLAAAGPFAPHALVFGVLLAALAAVAYGSVRRLRRTAPPAADASAVLARVLPFGTVAAAAVLPLATGLYLLTTTTWTLAERAVLYRLV
ncbi:MAG: YidC/Oxa1 family membrane protein insertase [Mycobacteriales bacterium]